MNKRIKELMVQVCKEQGLPFTVEHNRAYMLDNFSEKFAELIVRECVKVCADRGTHHDGLYSAWADDCSKRIGKHFGVEE
jgi:hypothetical protein